MWRCVSTNPGVTMPPAASISRVPSGTSRLRADRGDVLTDDENVGVLQNPGTESIVMTVALRKTNGRSLTELLGMG